MDNALIPGTQYHLPPPGADIPVTFGEMELAWLHENAPDMEKAMALYTNEQRAVVMDFVKAQMSPHAGVEAALEPKVDLKLDPTPAAPKSAKRTMSPEHKAKMKAGRAKAAARKAAQKTEE